MNAEIIAVGSELLTPYRMDTNSLFLTAQLNLLGVRLMRKSVVADDLALIRSAFGEALERVDLVISSGGLGPTADDLTREAVAELLGRKLIRDEEILHSIEKRFERFGRKMAEVNIRQAMVPEGATVLPNPRGTAPGLWLEAGGHIVVLLPGPPVELEPMFKEEVSPRLSRHAPNVRLFTRDVRIAGMSESEAEQRVAPIYTQYAGVETTILASPGEIQLHPRIWSGDPAEAEKLLDELVQRFEMVLGENVFTTSGESMEEVVASSLIFNQSTIATAESCTGGLLAERLTSLAGSSAYFRGGVVSYGNDLKTAWVDVPAELIEAKGAVSSEVALAMAEGVRLRSGASLGLSITGIAGPGGGSPEKPVGTVHIGLADSTGARERRFRYPGDRDRIRQQASQSALDMIRRYFLYGGHNKG
ncbi:MAG: competence/damage-inducible protein A [Candidatus Acidiferrales bacterium]